MSTFQWSIERLRDVTDAEIEELAGVLLDCVEGGASVSFMHPLGLDRAIAFWQRVAADVRDGKRALLVARDEQGICGTVQLVLEQPENQPHRADVAKMLVHRRARRRGLAAALIAAVDDAARASRKTLLVLDTITGSDASRVYERAGWTHVGVIPDYALMPRGGLAGTAVFGPNPITDSPEEREQERGLLAR
jgi:GNAT superfamily N-acetyltransferase